MQSNNFTPFVGEGCPNSDVEKSANYRKLLREYADRSPLKPRERVRNMIEKKHTIGTANEKSVPVLFGSKRPKIWLRRAPPTAHLAIKEYILNRGREAAAGSLANLKSVLGDQGRG